MTKIEKLEKDLALQYAKRDQFQSIVDNHQKNINSIKREIGEEKAKVRAEERDMKHKEHLKEKGANPTLWSNEKLNIDSNSKQKLKEIIFRYHDEYETIDFSIRELRLYLEEEANKVRLTGRDFRRDIFILNRRLEGLTYREIGELIGTSNTNASYIFGRICKQLKHPRIGRRILIKDK